MRFLTDSRAHSCLNFKDWAKSGKLQPIYHDASRLNEIISLVTLLDGVTKDAIKMEVCIPARKEKSMDAVELFESVLKQIEENYGSYRFFNERDIVWTLQKEILEQIGKLPYRVFHEYLFDKDLGKPAVDLAILDLDNEYPMKVALELKYEPDHERQGKDIRPSKYVKPNSQTVFWKTQKESSSVEEDVHRAHRLMEDEKAEVVYAIFIDEGGFHHTTRHRIPRIRSPFPGCDWKQWKPKNTLVSPWVHWFKKSKQGF